MATLVHELNALEELHDQLGFTYRELAAAIHAEESTLHRWRRGDGSAPSPVFLARLAALEAFGSELRRTFRSWDDARPWLDRGIAALHGETPRAMVLAGHVDRVTGVLYALNAGVGV